MKTLLGSLIAASLIGCYGYEVTVQTAPLSRGAYPPPNERFVEVYFNDAGPARTKAHEQICVIEVTGARHTPLSELVYELRQKAGSIGAEAVINVSEQPFQRVAGNILLDIARPEGYEPNVYHAVRLSGIAIKYR